jgi:8-amino-7-oxononanoate synthase
MTADYQQTLKDLTNSGRLREFRPLSGREGCRVTYSGQKMLNLTSNDYLGLAGNREIQEQFYKGMTSENLFDKYGLGAASSRLLTGDNPIAHLLEEIITCEYKRPACLLFNSGYHANIGILPTLFGKKDLILSDKLNHASIHDGMQLSRADHKRYRHVDYEHLTKLLESNRENYEKVIIVTESVFSMDGDAADLAELVAIKKRFDCMLYVDEAHSVGLYGRKGLGKAEEIGVIDDIDLLVGTFGKAYASVGAFVLCQKEIYSYLVNHSRSLIYTTALPPVMLYWNYTVFKHVLNMAKERKHLLNLASLLRGDLVDNGLRTDGTTNIVPVIIGDNQETVDLANMMQNEGYLIFPVRPPTVPVGTARFRLSLTADMQPSDIDGLAQLIKKRSIK